MSQTPSHLSPDTACSDRCPKQLLKKTVLQEKGTQPEGLKDSNVCSYICESHRRHPKADCYFHGAITNFPPAVLQTMRKQLEEEK